MTIAQYRQFLKNRQAQIKPESDEDEAAFEYFGEIQSIINVIDSGAMIHKIQEAADWVGEPCPLSEADQFRVNLKQCSDLMAAL